MIAYLSGAMEYANDEGESWRTNITEWLSKNLNFLKQTLTNF